MTAAVRRLLLVVALAGWSGLGATAADAVDLRGRVDTRNPYSGVYYPLPNAEVQLVFQGRILGRTLTGFDGFYYFRNAGVGPHQIIVNRQLRINVTILNRPYQDIQPILFQP